MLLMKHLERRKTNEKKTAGCKADTCRDSAGVFHSGPVSVFHSLCRNQIDFSRHCSRTAGGVEFFSDRNSSTSDLHMLFRKTFLRICLCIRIFWRCHKRSEGVINIVECGFLTNPDEAGLLQKDDYQQKVALAIADGIDEYCC